jgi:NitT/TauT family transport system permease protein
MRRTQAGPWRRGSVQAIVGAASFFVLWEVAALIVSNPVLPPPDQVVPLFFRLAAGELGLHFLASAARVVSAVVIAVLVAVPTGLALGLMKSLHRIFSPLLDFLHPIPKIVFLPVIYVLIGVSNMSKVLLITLILFFQVLVVVRDEARNLPKDLILSARSIGAGRWALYFFIYVPGTIPAMLTALRVSVGTAIAVLFIAEQSLTTYGLGYFIIVRTYQVLRYREMYAGILAISLLGILLYGAINLLERHVARYKHLEPTDET